MHIFIDMLPLLLNNIFYLLKYVFYHYIQYAINVIKYYYNLFLLNIF